VLAVKLSLQLVHLIKQQVGLISAGKSPPANALVRCILVACIMPHTAKTQLPVASREMLSPKFTLTSYRGPDPSDIVSQHQRLRQGKCKLFLMLS